MLWGGSRWPLLAAAMFGCWSVAAANTLDDETVRQLLSTKERDEFENNVAYALSEAMHYTSEENLPMVVYHLQNLIELDPDHCEGLYQLGITLIMEKRGKEALPLLVRAVEACSQHSDDRGDEGGWRFRD